MAVGVCGVTGGSVPLTQLGLEKEIAWSNLLQEKTIAEVTTSGTAVISELGLIGVGEEVNKEIAASVGREVVEKYLANQAQQGVGSGLIAANAQHGVIAIEKGSELAVGQSMMGAMKEGGSATLKSRAGNVVVQVGAK